MARKEAQLRRLRSRVLAETTVGKNVVAFVEENAADLSGALMEDEDVFGLAVRLIEPWLRQKNNFEILEAPIDSDTVQAFTQLADRLAKVRPTLGEQLASFDAVVSQAEPPSAGGKAFVRIAHGLYELYDTGAAHSEGAPSRSNRRERREARAGLVNARVEAGIGDFTKHLGIYDGQYPFRRSGQWSNHVETIRIRRERGTVEEAIQDDAFVATLHETLRSWGIGKRASRLAPLNVFAEILRQHTDELQDLDGMTIEYANADAEEILDRLWTFISTAEVVDNRAKVVAGTKTLHHLLPDLVPPMDREWTGRFFEWSLNDFQTRQREIFEEGYRSFVEIARQVQPSQYVGEDGERRQASSSTTRSSAT